MGVTPPPVTACCFFFLLFTLYSLHRTHPMQITMDRSSISTSRLTYTGTVRTALPRTQTPARGVRSGEVSCRARAVVIQLTPYTSSTRYSLQPTRRTSRSAARGGPWAGRWPVWGGASAWGAGGQPLGGWAPSCAWSSRLAGCRAGWATCDGRSVACWLISACRCPFARSYLVTVDSYRHGSGAAPRARFDGPTGRATPVMRRGRA